VVTIAAARVMPVRLRFAQPVRTARGEFVERASVLLELRDADGVAGYGEAAPWPGFGTESVADAESSLREVQALLENGATEPGCSRPQVDDRLRAAPAARAALQGALWDLAARRAGRPLAAHLAVNVGSTRGGVLHRVPVSALLVGREPDTVRQEAARAQAAGHLAVKLKLGGAQLAEDVARVRAARDALGPGVRLRGDANGAWTVREAFAALEALAPFGLEYIEQPVAANDIAGLAELRRSAIVRVAADESVATEQGLLRLLEAGAADVVVLKPATLGGAARALELAAQANQAGIGVVFTHAFESAIGARHVLHCAAAWGDPQGVHGLQTAGLFTADVAEPVHCKDGWVDVPVAPGLGVSP
jgi:o-succinylbenzoate synthase